MILLLEFLLKNTSTVANPVNRQREIFFQDFILITGIST